MKYIGVYAFQILVLSVGQNLGAYLSWKFYNLFEEIFRKPAFNLLKDEMSLLLEFKTNLAEGLEYNF